MQHPRFLAGAIAFGLLASALPASAGSGEVSSISLRDFNHNGKIDRAVLSFENPNLSNWTVRGISGFKATYKGEPIALSEAFIASTASQALLEVVFDENDPHLAVDTSASDFEISYGRVGNASGVSDGSFELATIPSGDATPAATERDEASPILVSSVPEPGDIDVLRTDPLTLTFSEPVDRGTFATTSSNNPGGWFYDWIGEGRTVSAQHDAYPRNALEIFGATAKDLAGNQLVPSAYPNPFTFRASNDNTPNPRQDELLLITSPVPNTALHADQATLISWYTNMPAVAAVTLSYSTNGGTSWIDIASLPASQKIYPWYPPTFSGILQLKAVGRTANDAFANISISGPYAAAAGEAIRPLHALSSAEIVEQSSASTTVSARLDRAPSSVTFSCNSGSITAPVSVSGDRPARLTARLSNLASGMTYACAFTAADAAGNTLSLPLPTFLAGEDSTAPELVGPAIIDMYDASSGTARLSWKTNETTTASVAYGTYLDYGSSASEATLATEHSAVLTGLKPGAMHQARITSIDAKGNASASKDFYFVFLRDTDLVKGTGSAVYWYKDGKRYVFPTIDIYRSWHGNDFSKIIRLPDTQLGTIPLAGNVKMKEGAFMVKIQSDPKTYAVEADGLLRWIRTEALARSLYGSAWSKRVRDLDASLFADYTIGDPI